VDVRSAGRVAVDAVCDQVDNLTRPRQAAADTVSQERVLSSGGATRLIDRMEADGLVTRLPDPDDRRGRRVTLTARGERTAVAAAVLHIENVQRHFLEAVLADHRERLIDDLRTLSHTARDALPPLP
jgi:DNA-binding MarR family transcriptional regulator